MEILLVALGIVLLGTSVLAFRAADMVKEIILLKKRLRLEGIGGLYLPNASTLKMEELFNVRSFDLHHEGSVDAMDRRDATLVIWTQDEEHLSRLHYNGTQVQFLGTNYTVTAIERDVSHPFHLARHEFVTLHLVAVAPTPEEDTQ